MSEDPTLNADPECRIVTFIDDDPDVRAVLLEAFEAEGFRVATAANGMQALHRVRDAAPDAIVLDLSMPLMSGEGFLYAWRAGAETHDVPVVAISKGPDRNAGREVFHLPGGREVTLPPSSPVLFHLQRLRDEAHRFAIGAHRQKRTKSIAASPLDDVPGIGPGRKRALLMHFGTARSVKGAALEDLEKAPGISRAMARTIYEHFHPAG